MESDELFPSGPAAPLPEDQHSGELRELIARYRVGMNQLVGRLLYLERLFRRRSDEAAEMVSGFMDGFLESCAQVPDHPAEWDGGKAYGSQEVFACVRRMYYSARDMRAVAKRIVTVRRHFYRDLCVLNERHAKGQSAFDRSAELRIDERRTWTDAERKKVWNQSDRCCRYCGKYLPSWDGETMHIDHIIPVIAGGSDDLENLAATCPECNLKKNAKSEDRFLAELLAGAPVPILDKFAKRKTKARGEDPLPFEPDPEPSPREVEQGERKRLEELEGIDMRHTLSQLGRFVAAEEGRACPPPAEAFEPLTPAERLEMEDLRRRYGAAPEDGSDNGGEEA